MNYTISVYKSTDDNTSRFVLGTEGKKPLCVLGLNPSTADEFEPDYTMKKVMGFGRRNGYDSFIMFNLYPLRSTDPKKLSIKCDNDLTLKNRAHILATLKNLNDVSLLAAWGETILEREYLFQCLKDIFFDLDYLKITWVKIGNLTASGHPRHPSRATYNNPLTKFDISSYLGFNLVQ